MSWCSINTTVSWVLSLRIQTLYQDSSTARTFVRGDKYDITVATLLGDVARFLPSKILAVSIGEEVTKEPVSVSPLA